MADEGFIRPDFGEDGRRAKRALLVAGQFVAIPMLTGFTLSAIESVTRGGDAAGLLGLIGCGMLTGWSIRRSKGAILSFGIGYALLGIPLVLSLIGLQGVGSNMPPLTELVKTAFIYGAIWTIGGFICCIGLMDYPRAFGLGPLAFGVGGAIGGVSVWAAPTASIAMPAYVFLPLVCGGFTIGWFTYGEPPKAAETSEAPK